jgi:hypothetical protein
MVSAAQSSSAISLSRRKTAEMLGSDSYSEGKKRQNSKDCGRNMKLLGYVFMAGAVLASAAGARESMVIQIAPAVSYADLADLAIGAPVAAHVRLARSTALKAAEAGPVAPGFSRHYVEAELVSLIKSDGGLPARVSYLADLPLGANGKPVKLAKKSEFLLLAQTVPARPGELRLVAPDAQLAFTPALAEQVRSILREASAAAPPPRVTGIGKAFHVRGSLPGESETQIFLQTADERPVSLSVIRRPGETARWAVALSEIVDDAATPPQPNTLLWYRLACTLPRALPAQSLADAAPDEAGAIRADYGLVMERLGACTRNRR